MTNISPRMLSPGKQGMRPLLTLKAYLPTISSPHENTKCSSELSSLDVFVSRDFVTVPDINLKRPTHDFLNFNAVVIFCMYQLNLLQSFDSTEKAIFDVLQLEGTKKVYKICTPQNMLKTIKTFYFVTRRIIICYMRKLPLNMQEEGPLLLG